MLLERIQRITQIVALLDIANRRLFLRQCIARDFHQFAHERLAFAHRTDNAGAEDGSQIERCLGHGK